MTEGRQRESWMHTTKIYLLLLNVNRDEKKRKKPYEFQDVYPFKLRWKQKKQRPPEGPITALKCFLRK